MKKLFFLTLMIIAFANIDAKAQDDCNCVITTISQYRPGDNLTSTFSYYFSADGYLYYSLSAPVVSGNESDLYIYEYDNNTTYANLNQTDGGDIIGSVYVGTTDISFITIEAGSGALGPPSFSVDGWDMSVSFDNCTYNEAAHSKK